MATTSRWRVVRALLDWDTGHRRRFVSTRDVALRWTGIAVWNGCCLLACRWVRLERNWSPLHRRIHSWSMKARLSVLPQEGENVVELQEAVTWETTTTGMNRTPYRHVLVSKQVVSARCLCLETKCTYGYRVRDLWHSMSATNEAWTEFHWQCPAIDWEQLHLQRTKTETSFHPILSILAYRTHVARYCKQTEVPELERSNVPCRWNLNDEHGYQSKLTQDEENLLGSAIFGSSYGAISGFADRLREWLDAGGLSIFVFDDFERDLALVVTLLDAVGGVEEGGIGRVSFVGTGGASVERRFDWDSMGRSRSRRLFGWNPFIVTLERSDGVERIDDDGGMEGK